MSYKPTSNQAIGGLAAALGAGLLAWLCSKPNKPAAAVHGETDAHKWQGVQDLNARARAAQQNARNGGKS